MCSPFEVILIDIFKESLIQSINIPSSQITWALLGLLLPDEFSLLISLLICDNYCKALKFSNVYSFVLIFTVFSDTSMSCQKEPIWTRFHNLRRDNKLMKLWLIRGFRMICTRISGLHYEIHCEVYANSDKTVTFQ